MAQSAPDIILGKDIVRRFEEERAREGGRSCHQIDQTEGRGNFRARDNA